MIDDPVLVDDWHPVASVAELEEQKWVFAYLVLFRGIKKTEQPEALGQPYIRGAR